MALTNDMSGNCTGTPRSWRAAWVFALMALVTIGIKPFIFVYLFSAPLKWYALSDALSRMQIRSLSAMSSYDELRGKFFHSSLLQLQGRALTDYYHNSYDISRLRDAYRPTMPLIQRVNGISSSELGKSLLLMAAIEDCLGDMERANDNLKRAVELGFVSGYKKLRGCEGK